MSIPFNHQSWHRACAPYAIARLLGVSYRAVARRIWKLGANHHCPPLDAVQRLLAPHGIVQEMFFTSPVNFNTWRQGQPGYWVLIVTTPGSPGHCITLKEGAALDNGWMGWGGKPRIMSAKVHAAWQIEHLVARRH